MECASQVPNIYQEGAPWAQSYYFKQKHCLARNDCRTEFQHSLWLQRKDAILASKCFPKHIPRHPWERSECPLVKMWETFPYVIFGWQEGAAVFPVKIHSLGALVSLRRMGTPWSWSSTVWKRSPKRGKPAGRAEGGTWSYVLETMGDWFYFSAPGLDGLFPPPPNPLSTDLPSCSVPWEADF